MKFAKYPLIILSFLILLTSQTEAQPKFINCYLIKTETPKKRKKDIIEEIVNSYESNGQLIINFRASLDKGKKNQPYHVVLAMDSLLSHFSDNVYFEYEFDSLAELKHHLHRMERRYEDINGRPPNGIDVMCRRDIIQPGFQDAADKSTSSGKIEIISERKKEPYEIENREYLWGKHLVFLYDPDYQLLVNDHEIHYIVINIENTQRVRKASYLLLPFAAIADVVMLPFVLMVSGMEK